MNQSTKFLLLIGENSCKIKLELLKFKYKIVNSNDQNVNLDHTIHLFDTLCMKEILNCILYLFLIEKYK